MISLMRLAFSLYFLTLVVSAANAAPKTDIKPVPVDTRTTSEGRARKSVHIEPVQATESPAVKRYSFPREILSDGSTNLGVSSLAGKFDEDKETKNLFSFHIQRTHYNLNEIAQEFGISILGGESKGYVGADWGYKVFCCFTHRISKLDPFYKLGAAAVYDPEDQLGNFIDYKKYFIQAGIGFDSLFGSRRAWHFEIGGRVGYSGLHSYLSFLYAFPD